MLSVRDRIIALQAVDAAVFQEREPVRLEERLDTNPICRRLHRHVRLKRLSTGGREGAWPG